MNIKEKVLKILPLPPGADAEHPIAVLMRVLGKREREVKDAVWGLVGEGMVEIGDDLGLRKVELG